MALEQQLEEGIQSLGLDIDNDVQDQLIEYIYLLAKWNRAYNLTAVRDPKQMVTRHLLDSLSIVQFIDGDYVLDVGSGAGLPGIPLALCLPDIRFSLLDSNGKKTRFLFQVKTALGLDNMTVRHARAEAWNPEQPYDVVLSRAFASLVEMMKRCAHLCDGKGSFLAMKGSLPERELAAVAAEWEIRQVHPLSVPGLNEDRHLIELGLRGVGNTLG